VKKLLIKIKKLVKNPHFVLTTAISVIIILLYNYWPWRQWLFPSPIQQLMPWIGGLHHLAIFETMSRFVGILFTIPIIYASITLSWPGALYASLLSFVSIVPIIKNYPMSVIASNLMILLVPFLLLSIINFEIEHRRGEKARFKERENDRKIYLSKLNIFVEKERQRLARELHDETIQNLLIINRLLESLTADNYPEIVKQQAESAKNICTSSVENLRGICLRLRPDILDNLGLVPALRWMVDQINKRNAIPIDFYVEGKEAILSSEAETNIFRSIQESLINIERHSQAKNASLNLNFNDGYLNIIVKDNGRGFDVPKDLEQLAVQGKLGLIGIKQRIESVNGHFQIESSPGGGTVLSMILVPSSNNKNTS
jgi:two-component system sensor histidine kinase DegS